MISGPAPEESGIIAIPGKPTRLPLSKIMRHHSTMHQDQHLKRATPQLHLELRKISSTDVQVHFRKVSITTDCMSIRCDVCRGGTFPGAALAYIAADCYAVGSDRNLPVSYLSTCTSHHSEFVPLAASHTDLSLAGGHCASLPACLLAALGTAKDAQHRIRAVWAEEGGGVPAVNGGNAVHGAALWCDHAVQALVPGTGCAHKVCARHSAVVSQPVPALYGGDAVHGAAL
eukprot:1161652-Pelagomonas_calceolata.AAC.3